MSELIGATRFCAATLLNDVLLPFSNFHGYNLFQQTTIIIIKMEKSDFEFDIPHYR